jgi:hypothetical protein
MPCRPQQTETTQASSARQVHADDTLELWTKDWHRLIARARHLVRGTVQPSGTATVTSQAQAIYVDHNGYPRADHGGRGTIFRPLIEEHRMSRSREGDGLGMCH